MRSDIKRIKIYDLDDVVIGKTKILSALPVDNMDVFCLGVNAVSDWCTANKLDYNNVFWDFA